VRCTRHLKHTKGEKNMGKIQVLDKSVSNKIAAGEVVERPASVVKELLENALDAGATNVVVEIKNGGITYIRVTDNGCGIPHDEVSVALLRHATSKISQASDLEKIETLGFRGEALSSIAAVSKMEIYTRTREEEIGTHLVAQDGHVTECSEAGCPVGTTVVVRDLFVTTPARMKFLKKNYTEAGYVGDIVNRLALAHAEVSFRLLTDGKETLFTTGDSSLLGCIYAIYGKDLKSTMQPASYEEGGVGVTGFCATGAGARPNRSMQSFFVNGRYIKSPLLSHAVEEAYKNEIMGGKFPACVLLVTLSPAMVDINVHPTKLEAKFADEKAVYHCVYWAAKNALYQKQEIPAVTLRSEEEDTDSKQVTGGVDFAAKRNVFSTSIPVMQEPPLARQNMTPSVWQGLSMRKQKGEEVAFGAPQKQEPINEKTQPSMDRGFPRGGSSEKTFKQHIFTNVPVAEQAEISLYSTEQTVTASSAKTEDYRICGRIFDTYIIVEKAGQMLLIDQHAAHERLRYETLLKQFEGRQVESQMLLLPISIRLTAAEEALFLEYAETLSAMGFEAESFGEKTVLLRGAPEALDEEGLKSLFLEVLGHLDNKRKDARSQRTQRALYTIACRSAIKAGNKLQEAEIRSLLDAVFALEAINTCPHGRPITVSMTKGFIEKQFKRIV